MLKLEDEALELFFEDEILYRMKVAKAVDNPGYTYDGGNNKYILMLFNGPVSGADRQFLERILASVKLTLDDVALLDISTAQDKNFESLKSYFAPSAMFMWGVAPAAAGLQAEKYNLSLIEKVKIVPVDSLAEVSKDEVLKQKLWAILKGYFLQ